MRLLPLFLLIFLFFDVIDAQRRTTARPDSTSVTPRTVSRGRGRSRFTSTADYVQPQDSTSTPPEPTSRRVSSRKRVIDNTEHRIPPRVVGALLKTENSARLPNATPKPEILPRVSNPATKSAARVSNFVPRSEVVEKKPSKLESTDRRSLSAGETERKSPRTSSERVRSSHPSKNSYEVQEIIDEPLEFAPLRRAKKLRVSTQNQQSESKSFPRRNSLQNLPTESPEAFKSTVENAVSTESPVVPPEDANTVEETDDTTLPSEVSSEPPAPIDEPPADLNPQFHDTPKIMEPARSQGGRRNGATRRTPSVIDQTTQATRSRARTRATKVPEVLFQAAAPTRGSRRRAGGPSVFTAEVAQSESRSRTGRTVEPSPEKITIDLNSGRGRRRLPGTTSSSKGRSRSREVPPVVDETKLEVLPLFEAEPVMVRVRGRPGAEDTQAMMPKEVESATRAVGRERPGGRNEVRQSVVSRVSQVVSRGTLARKKGSGLGVKIKAFDPLARGSKKGETRRSEKGKMSSSEEIGEGDNYPEHFKALLKAKKGGKESSAEKIARSEPDITNLVTASSSPTRFSSAGISEPLTVSNDLDNELFPITPSTTTPLPRTPRSRSSRNPSENPAPPTNYDPARRTNGGVVFKPKEGDRRRDRGDGGRKMEQQVATKVPKLVSAVVNVDRRKYRSDLTSRSTLTRSTTNAPRYIPTIPSMPYVPTVPTLTPQRTSVFSGAAKKDPELGMEVISFDDPVPPLLSENLVRDDSVSTENQFSIALPLVSDSTTEKPVSIFERIINSLTAISTPPSVSMNTSGLSSTTESGSAILKLAPKKPDYDDTAQTLLTPTTFTTDKSTTIIEKILSSINAIQATDNTRSSQVRTDFNTLSFTTTPSVSALTNTATDTTLTPPAQFSTSSIDPLSILNEITPEQALQKHTIGKLLEILNGMVSTTLQPQKLVVVTPKSINFASAVNTDETRLSFDPSTTSLPSMTSEPSTIPISTTTEISSTTLPSSTETTNEDITTVTDSTMSDSELLGTSSTTTESETSTTLLSIATEGAATSFPSTSEVGLSSTTVDPYSSFSLLSTLPPLQKFEVSPGSVSVFSANDLPNSITPEDNFSTTVSILSRVNFDNTDAATQGTTTVSEPTTTESFASTTEESMMMMTTTLDSTTTPGSGTIEASTVDVNREVASNRSGRLLNFPQDSVRNGIDLSTPGTTTSTTPDYYVFAVLNNNTILRKKPAMVPDKRTPYLIVGVYPDNRVVRRYPNGTMVPMERVIRADQNSIPTFEANSLSLPKGSTSTTAATNLATISTPERSPRTNNRVFTSTSASSRGGTGQGLAGTTQRSLGTTQRSSEVATLGSTLTSMGTTESDLGSSTVSSSTNPTLSTLSELFDGRTLNALNEIVNNSVTTNTDTVTTTSQSAKYNKVLNIQDLLSSRTSGQPISITRTTIIDKVDATTLQPELSSTLSSIGTTIAPSTTTETTFTESANKVTTQGPTAISNEISGDRTTTEVSTTSAPTTTAPTTTASTTTTPTTTSPTTTAPTTTAPTTTVPTTTAPTTTTTVEAITTTTTTDRISTTTKAVRLTSTPIRVPSTLPTRLPEAVPTAPLFPTFLTTLFPNLFAADGPATRAPRVLTTKNPAIIRISAPPSVTENLFIAASTTRATTVAPPSTYVNTTSSTTTTPKTTTVRPTTESTTLPTTATTPESTTTPRATTTIATTTTFVPTVTKSEPVTDLNTIDTTTKKKLKVLSEEQKENLKTLMQLEKEQAALLQQLSFLTNLNFGRTATPKKTNNEKTQKQTSKDLADRVVALAVERDKTAKTTTQKSPASIQDQLAAIDATRTPKQVTPSVEEVLRQYNLGDLDVASTPGSSYGKSNDAILASILKQQGIAPATPKSLADQIKQAGLFEERTTRKPKPKPRPRPTTTPAPGRLMQGLNWLLNVLAPPPQSTPRPSRKPAKPKKPPVDQQRELLATSPTHVTPVVTAAPSKMAHGANALSQEDIQKLIAQLEGLQKDTGKRTLDLSQIKSLQNLINTDEGVVVLANGEHGTTPRRTATPTTATPTTKAGATRKRQERKLTTVSSNRVEEEEDFEVTTKKHKAPIGFRPVPGVDDDSSESLVRSNLITAAVNVTKALSGFLGTALQGAAQSFQSIWGSGSALGSRVLGGAASGSSAGPG